MTMNATELTEQLTAVLMGEDPELIEHVRSIRSFADRGLLTNNEGLVLTLTDGSEFQIQVIQSEQASRHYAEIRTALGDDPDDMEDTKVCPGCGETVLADRSAGSSAACSSVARATRSPFRLRSRMTSRRSTKQAGCPGLRPRDFFGNQGKFPRDSA
jgi:hypothetical protein